MPTPSATAAAMASHENGSGSIAMFRNFAMTSSFPHKCMPDASAPGPRHGTLRTGARLGIFPHADVETAAVASDPDAPAVAGQEERTHRRPIGKNEKAQRKRPDTQQ